MPADQTTENEIKPDWAQPAAFESVARLDVRPTLASGTDPFEQIMNFMSELRLDENFAVIASFDPQPLRRLLAARGYASYGEQIEPDHWQILFRSEDVADGSGDTVGQEPKTWNEEKLLHVDLRGLAPPGPLVFILSLLDRPGMSKEVIIHLEQDPVYLYPELNERNWDWERLDGDADEIRLRLFRPNSD